MGTILEFFFIPVFPDPCLLNPKLSSKFLRLVHLPSKYFLNSSPLVLVSSSDPLNTFLGEHGVEIPGRCMALLLTAWCTSTTTRPSLPQCLGSSSYTRGWSVLVCPAHPAASLLCTEHRTELIRWRTNPRWGFAVF